MKDQFDQFEACWLCEGRHVKDLYAVNGFTIAKCTNCSLCFVRDIVDDEYLKEVYARMATQIGHRVYVEKSNEKNLQYAHAAVANKIKTYFKFQDNLNILDLGCSNGSFLEQFPNWNVYGIELEKTTGRIAQSKHKNIFIGNMKDSIFEKEFFDCITINDALDHSNDPDFVVEHCHSLLKTDGIIVLKVHNIDCLLARLTGKKFYAVIPPIHLSYFNLKTLKILLKKHNFGYLNHFYNTQKLRLDNATMRAAASLPLLYPLQKIAENTFLGASPSTRISTIL